MRARVVIRLARAVNATREFIEYPGVDFSNDLFATMKTHASFSHLQPPATFTLSGAERIRNPVRGAFLAGEVVLDGPSAKLFRITGTSLIALGVGLNVPFGILGATFHYPDILRQPTAAVLTQFHAGGVPLIATWYAFVAAALFLVPVALFVHDALATTSGQRASTIVRMATLAGIGAGVMQALGLIRWVFVVPVLARTFCDPTTSEPARAAAVGAFESLHQYAGVALGEHLGQLGTALWMVLIAGELTSRFAFARWLAWLGFASGGLITLGLVEGFATVIPFAVGVLGLATPVGYVGLSGWLVAIGVTFIRRAKASHR